LLLLVVVGRWASAFLRVRASWAEDIGFLYRRPHYFQGTDLVKCRAGKSRERGKERLGRGFSSGNKWLSVEGRGCRIVTDSSSNPSAFIRSTCALPEGFSVIPSVSSKNVI